MTARSLKTTEALLGIETIIDLENQLAYIGSQNY